MNGTAMKNWMKENAGWMRNCLFILIVFMVVLNSFLVYASPEELNVEQTINSYYRYFSQKDLDNFISLKIIGKKNLGDVKRLTKEEWDAFDVLSYSLSNINYDIYRNVAIVSYDLNMRLGYNSQILNLNENMKAVLIKTNGIWKILILDHKNLVDEVLVKMKITSLNDFNTSDRDDFSDYNEGDFEKNKKNSDSSCGDGICELGEICSKDCKELSYKSKCGDGICDKNEDCIYDCQSPRKIDLSRKEEYPNCEYDESFSGIENVNLYKLGLPNWIASKLSDRIVVKLIVTDEKSDNYFELEGGKIYKKDNADSSKINYIIRLDSCTLSSLSSGDLSFKDAYNQNLISIEGNSIGTRLKTFFARVTLAIMNFFNPQPVKIVYEAETGTLENQAKYSFIGNIAGHFSLYLGNKGSKMVYDNVNVPFNGDAYVYIKTYDDGKHGDGSRDSEFTFGKQKLLYNHKSRNDGWKWEYLGKIHVKNGRLVVTVEKPKQTNAAFIMDKFMITSNKDLN